MSVTINTSYNVLADKHTTQEISKLNPENNAIVYDIDLETYKIYRDDTWVDFVEYDNKYLKSQHITVSKDNDVNLSDAQFKNLCMLRLSWDGVNGTMALNLPNASQNEDRLIRIISNSTFDNSTHTDLTPINGDTLDGSTNSYRINKSYEGILVWSDGTEWFIIQKKA